MLRGLRRVITTTRHGASLSSRAYVNTTQPTDMESSLLGIAAAGAAAITLVGVGKMYWETPTVEKEQILTLYSTMSHMVAQLAVSTIFTFV